MGCAEPPYGQTLLAQIEHEVILHLLGSEIRAQALMKEKKPNKTVVATAGNVLLSLRSGRTLSAVPHL